MVNRGESLRPAATIPGWRWSFSYGFVKKAWQPKYRNSGMGVITLVLANYFHAGIVETTPRRLSHSFASPGAHCPYAKFVGTCFVSLELLEFILRSTSSNSNTSTRNSLFNSTQHFIFIVFSLLVIAQEHRRRAKLDETHQYNFFYSHIMKHVLFFLIPRWCKYSFQK